MIFGYNRSYGSNVLAEIAIAITYFSQGADGFVLDAEAEWESDNSWIGSERPGQGLAALLDRAFQLADEIPGSRSLPHHQLPYHFSLQRIRVMVRHRHAANLSLPLDRRETFAQRGHQLVGRQLA